MGGKDALQTPGCASQSLHRIPWHWGGLESPGPNKILGDFSIIQQQFLGKEKEESRDLQAPGRLSFRNLLRQELHWCLRALGVLFDMDLSDSLLNLSIFLVAMSFPPTQRSITAPVWSLPCSGGFVFLLALHSRANLRTAREISVPSTTFLLMDSLGTDVKGLGGET